ncbi:signal peptidase I [Microbacterium sp. G2-8]|uniref:signal peptidase I n=1 Tax=Microbacterium sp. G2-8 TaxID=2842454 RepID=UPI001C89BEF4|nr:signal peptidase I [Microbacterium sp. G2-8]
MSQAMIRTASVATVSAARRTGHLGRRIALIAAGATAATGAALTLMFAALHVTPLVIISGSMEPGYPVGTIVYTQQVDADTLEPGDIVTTDRFNGPGTVTHRVVEIEGGADDASVLTLKGDANEGVDRETYEVTEVGISRFAIPYIGLPQLWIQDALGIDPLTA